MERSIRLHSRRSNKLRKNFWQRKRITCYCDATIVLRIIAHAFSGRLKFRRKGPGLWWLLLKFLKKVVSSL